MSIADGTDQEFQKSLMEKGVYPENTPPPFRVKRFYSICDQEGILSTEQIKRNKPTRLSTYNETKRGGQRRIFSTPNPLFFIDTASYFKKNRQKFVPLLQSSSFSKSVPIFDDTTDRFLRIESHSDFTRFRRTILSTSRYIVKTDIARFFPSIYTHSISWAVHGKILSKSNRSTASSRFFANKLDYLIRQAQDQQTIGIPVGPDTSRIVSELIAGAVDRAFIDQVGADVAGARLVDDVFLGAGNYDEAENLLSSYRDSLRQYELDINESKTSILEARHDLEPFWPVDIRREMEGFSSGGRAKPRIADLVAYLDEIIRLANATNDDGIIKYAIRKMDQLRLWHTYWDAIEAFLVRVAIVFPHCVDYVVRVVIWYNRFHDIDTTKWRKVCETIIGYHAKLGNDSEVAWSCWLLKELGEPLHKDLCEAIIRRCGPFSVLLTLDLFLKGLISGKFPRSLIYCRLGNSPMLSEDWLLSYEAERSFGFRLKKKNRNDYEVFGTLIDGNVEFYDTGALPSVFEGVDDFNSVDRALEDRGGLYEDEDDEDDDDDDDEFSADSLSGL